MALLGLFVFAFVLVAASAEPSLDVKQAEISSIVPVHKDLSRTSRSVEDRFGLIRKGLRLLQTLIDNVLRALKNWFFPQPPPPFWPPTYNNYNQPPYNPYQNTYQLSSAHQPQY